MKDRFTTDPSRMRGESSQETSPLGAAVGVGAGLLGALLTYRSQKDILNQKLRDQNAAQLATQRASEASQRAVMGAAAQAEGGVGLLAGIRAADQMQRGANQQVAQAQMFDLARQDAFDKEQRIRKERLGAGLGSALATGGALLGTALTQDKPGRQDPPEAGKNFMGDAPSATGFGDPSTSYAAGLTGQTPEDRAAVQSKLSTGAMENALTGAGIVGEGPGPAEQAAVSEPYQSPAVPARPDVLGELLGIPAGQEKQNMGAITAFNMGLTRDQVSALQSKFSDQEIQSMLQKGGLANLKASANSIMGAPR